MRGAKPTLAIIDVSGLSMAFLKLFYIIFIWKSAIGFEIGALLVWDSHTSESPVWVPKLKFGYYWHFWTIDGIFEAFQKASIWKSAIGFEIGALLVCDSHTSESPVWVPRLNLAVADIFGPFFEKSSNMVRCNQVWNRSIFRMWLTH